MTKQWLKDLSNQVAELNKNDLYRHERLITSQQQVKVDVEKHGEVINFCANNYLGFANHPELVKTGQDALAEYGFGMSSVRFICGTHQVHRELEEKISGFLGTGDTILYSSCFDANCGLFETLLEKDDAIISDELNHASIIDGVRLCKATRYRYANNNMDDLEKKLVQAQDQRRRLIATDGVFSMDGTLANLPAICELAQKYDAFVMVDDSHAVGFMGECGRGSAEHWQVQDQIDIITGTLGKALGGASGGYTSGRKEVIDWLRQYSRPYLFSNTLAPAIAKTSIHALELVRQGKLIREKLHSNSKYLRQGLEQVGFTLIAGEHPIIPILIGDDQLANQIASALLEEGIYVVGFSYPVVPQGKARIRLQMSAAHNKDHLDQAIEAFIKVGRQFRIIQ